LALRWGKGGGVGYVVEGHFVLLFGNKILVSFYWKKGVVVAK
jgi:hypothetical protein